MSLKQAAAGARAWPPSCMFSCVLLCEDELELHCMNFLFYANNLCHRQSSSHVASPCAACSFLPAASLSTLSLDLFFLIFFFIKEAVFLVRHSQPQPHHGRFDASFLHSWMLTFSECWMAEQLLSQRGIIQKAKRLRQLTRSLQHPRAWRLLVLLS